jgi:hypothetical protein
LFESVLTDLEFAECDEIEIEDIVLLFVLTELSKEFYDTSERICSSGDFQHFVIEALDSETVS